MRQFQGQTLSWDLHDGIIELTLHREPLNEISSSTLEELEKFVTLRWTHSVRTHTPLSFTVL